MNWKKITCTMCGLAFCGHMAHEAHQNDDYIARPLVAKPMLDTVLYVRLPHGEEPEAPSGPLHWPGGTIAVSSGSLSSSATVTLAGVSASGSVGTLVTQTSGSVPST